MKIPVVEGVIDRRILANFRIDPEILKNHLPAPFVPKLINGYGMGGICLIRLKNIRPLWAPKFLSLSSENAAHRFAVEWEDEGVMKEGVFIPRRDSSSWMNSVLGGRLFPGVHHYAEFIVRESGFDYFVEMTAKDGSAHVLVDAKIANSIPSTSIFSSIKDCSTFFERGSLGYSSTGSPQVYDGLELKVFDWKVQPLKIERVESSYFSNEKVFPKGSTEFDCALLMVDIRHQWHGREELCCASA
ncbi:MAG: hypothetical protein COB53_07690 [Elusimicrobia bacterium]|nr:MAG: hypothetical protein COB53_07690 [Elusimicrobiota bacterium]